MFYLAAVAGVLLYAVVYWGGSGRKIDNKWLNRIIIKAGSEVVKELDVGRELNPGSWQSLCHHTAD